MTAHIYTEADAPIDPLKGKRLAVIGYGSQGHAHALNAHDSGLDVMVGLYKGSKSWAKAEQAGLKVAEVADATRQADVIVMLVPDEKQRRIFEDSIRDRVNPGSRWSGRTASTSTSSRSSRPKASTCGWSPPRRPATACASCSSRARAFLRWSPSSKTRPAKPGSWRLRTATRSAAPRPA